MVDLSKLSDEQLQSLVKLSEPEAAAKSGPDLSKLSNEQLNKLVTQTAPVDDHGYARRAKMGAVERTLSPITEYFPNVRDIGTEGVHQFGRGVEQFSQAVRDAKGGLYEPGEVGRLWEGVKGLGNIAGGALGYLGSPLWGAYRSVVGHPVEDLTGIPREYSEFVAQLGSPRAWGGLVGEPRPPSGPPPGFTDIPQTPLQRLKNAGVDLELARGITSQNPVVQGYSANVSKLPYIGEPLAQAAADAPKKVESQVAKIAEAVGPEVEPNVVGSGIQRTLTKGAEEEAATAQAAAEAEHAAKVKAWEAENAARVQAIETRQAEANAAAEQKFGNVHPMEMAQDTINDVQSAHRQGRAARDAAYEDVNNLDARVKNSAFLDVRQRAEQALSDAGFTVDDPGSNAAKMLAELDRLSGKPAVPATPPPGVPKRVQDALDRTYGENIPAEAYEQFGFTGGTPATEAVPPDFRLTGAHAPAPGAQALSVQGVDQLSKRIGRMGMDATTPSDQAASRIIKNAFDDWRNDALGSHLTADSEAGAGAVIDKARAAHRDLMDRFGYNYKRLPEGEPRRAAKLLNQIVTEGLGPEALRDNLIGMKPGNRPVSAPLYEAISNAVPDAAAFRDRVRGAYWNAASEGSPAAVARNVEGLTPTRMGSHLFDAGEHDLMRNVARVGEETPAQLREAARVAKENTPKLEKPEPGRAQQIAAEAVGGSGEETHNTLDKMFRTDIKGAARTWGRLNEANRTEFINSWLRGLGGGGEDFSLAKFVTNWDKYSDQAKAILLRDRGHRENLTNLVELARQHNKTIARFGNPSGTAQATFWQKLITGSPAALGALWGTNTIGTLTTLGTVASALGTRGLSHLLARPSGAAQVMRWHRLAKAYEAAPSARTFALLSSASRSLNNQ